MTRKKNFWFPLITYFTDSIMLSYQEEFVWDAQLRWFQKLENFRTLEVPQSLPKSTSPFSHIHLKLENIGPIERLYYISMCLYRTSVTGRILFLTWKANPSCPGYIHDLFDLDPAPEKFPGGGILKKLTPFWKFINLTPKISTPSQPHKQCTKCFKSTSNLVIPSLPLISPLQEIEIQETTNIKVPPKSIISWFKFFFSTVNLLPDFQTQVLRASEFMASKGSRGVYIHSSIWKEKKNEILRFLISLQQIEETNIFICTNSKYVVNSLHKESGPKLNKILLFSQGELPGQEVKHVSSVFTTLQDCYVLASCSSIWSFPDFQSIVPFGLFFRSAAIAIHELVKQKRKETPTILQYLPYSAFRTSPFY
jgi:hypothetical protein